MFFLDILQSSINSVNIGFNDIIIFGGDTNCCPGIQEQLPFGIHSFNLNMNDDSYDEAPNGRGKILNTFMSSNNFILVNGR